jgi:hypothetical protein
MIRLLMRPVGRNLADVPDYGIALEGNIYLTRDLTVFTNPTCNSVKAVHLLGESLRRCPDRTARYPMAPPFRQSFRHLWIFKRRRPDEQ